MSSEGVEMEKNSSDTIKEAECGSLKTQEIKTKTYKIRWLILGIFVLYSATNAMQWIQLTIINDVLISYFGVGKTYVDMTSLIFMITYIPFIFPASWFLDRFGLRYSVLVGAFGTTLGSWIKTYVARDKFWVTFIGQTVVAVSQTFILSVPARLAAVWFGPNQVSSACSIGVFGNQLGIALGFPFPQMFVSENGTAEATENGLKYMFYSVATISSIILVLILIFFQAQPILPPSSAQALQRESEQSENFALSLKRLFLNVGYMLLLLSYAINVGAFYSISTLLSDIVGAHFANSTEHAGYIGLTMVCAGMLGSVVCGVILDKTRKFKETTFGIYIFSFLGMIVFTFVLRSGSIAFVYLVSGLLGFFMTGYLPVGFELATELTFPEPEGTSAGLLNAMTQIFGILFTLAYRFIFESWGDLWANIVLCVVLAVGAVITALIPNDLRRQNAK